MAEDRPNEPADQPEDPKPPQHRLGGGNRRRGRVVERPAERRATGRRIAARWTAAGRATRRRQSRQPVRGAVLLAVQRRHECDWPRSCRARSPARRWRWLDVRRRPDRSGIRRQLGGHQGHGAQDRGRPRPRPDAGPAPQQRAITEAVSHRRGLARRRRPRSPASAPTVAAWSRAEWIEQTMPVWRRLVEPVATHIADAMEGALSFGGDDDPGMPRAWPGWSRCSVRCCAPPAPACSGCNSARVWVSWPARWSGPPTSGCRSSEPGHVALLPTNVAAFGEGLEQSEHRRHALPGPARVRPAAAVRRRPAGCARRC